MNITTNLPIGVLTVDLTSRKVVHILNEDSGLLLNQIYFFGDLKIDDPSDPGRCTNGWTSSPTVNEDLIEKCTTVDSIFSKKTIFDANTGEIIQYSF